MGGIERVHAPTQASWCLYFLGGLVAASTPYCFLTTSSCLTCCAPSADPCLSTAAAPTRSPPFASDALVKAIVAKAQADTRGAVTALLTADASSQIARQRRGRWSCSGCRVGGSTGRLTFHIPGCLFPEVAPPLCWLLYLSMFSMFSPSAHLCR